MSNTTLTKNTTRLSWVMQLIAAVILGQTLFFKFTGAPEAVYIFTTLGVEPWGRIGTGVLELITVLLLVIPNARGIAAGAALAMGLMGGAIFSHLTRLGIEVQGDGGLLFGMAFVVLFASAIVLLLRRGDLPVVGPRLAAQAA